jgi:hypothetical protein
VRDHILILNILFFNKLRQIIPANVFSTKSEEQEVNLVWPNLCIFWLLFICLYRSWSWSLPNFVWMNISGYQNYRSSLRQIIPEIRSERRDLLIFIFILKTTGTFTPVHSAGYLILRNEFRSTQEVARQNIQVSFYIRSTGLWPNTWIHVSHSLEIIRNAILILLYTNLTKLSNTPLIRQCALICTHS